MTLNFLWKLNSYLLCDKINIQLLFCIARTIIIFHFIVRNLKGKNCRLITIENSFKEGMIRD